MASGSPNAARLAALMTGTEFGTRERQNDDRTARRPIKQLPDELQQPLIPELAFVVEVFSGISTLVVDVLAVTALQRAADQLTRVFGVFFALVIGAIALGTVLSPVVVSAGGLNAGLWTMAVAPAVLALAGYPRRCALSMRRRGRERASSSPGRAARRARHLRCCPAADPGAPGGKRPGDDCRVRDRDRARK